MTAITRQEDKANYEKSLQESNPEAQPAAADEIIEDIIAGPHLNSYNSLTSKPIFPAGKNKSLLCKYLSEEIWN